MLSPTNHPSRLTTQLTARSSRAASLSSSTASATAVLCGIVTDRPADAERTHGLERGLGLTLTHVEGEVDPIQTRSAAKAALWMAGEIEWVTGEPMTAASWVCPVIRRSEFG